MNEGFAACVCWVWKDDNAKTVYISYMCGQYRGIRTTGLDCLTKQEESANRSGRWLLEHTHTEAKLLVAVAVQNKQDQKPAHYQSSTKDRRAQRKEMKRKSITRYISTCTSVSNLKLVEWNVENCQNGWFTIITMTRDWPISKASLDLGASLNI